MPSFQQAGPSLRDVVTGIPAGLVDTARMATTPPPPMPKGAWIDDGGLNQGTADPEEWRAWLTEMQRRADLGPSLAADNQFLDPARTNQAPYLFMNVNERSIRGGDTRSMSEQRRSRLGNAW